MADILKCISWQKIFVISYFQILLEFIPDLSVNNSYEQMLTKFADLYMRHSIGLDE